MFAKLGAKVTLRTMYRDLNTSFDIISKTVTYIICNINISRRVCHADCDNSFSQNRKSMYILEGTQCYRTIRLALLFKVKSFDRKHKYSFVQNRSICHEIPLLSEKLILSIICVTEQKINNAYPKCNMTLKF